VPTPLNEDESPDMEGVESLINFLVDNNVGLFALGSAGEQMNLPFDTKVKVAKKMAEVNNGRVPILMGGGTFGIQEALDFCEEIKDCKIDGIHIISYDKKLSGPAIEKFYFDLADKTPFPLWLYQNTTRSNGIPIDSVKRLKQHPNIAGCKVAGFNHRDNLGFVMLQDDGIQVIGSADSQFFTFMCLGTKANTTSSASCFPEIFNELYQKLEADSLKEARKKNLEILRFLNRIPKTAYKDNGESSAEIKYILSLRGICKEYCAKPFRSLNDNEKKKTREVYDDYKEYLETGVLKMK
jgi:4-hydroxy-tetrahydrodipicolinate synthase